MNSGFKGFDPEKVKSSINGVVMAYDELFTALQGKMQTEFVNAMADKWACNQAITFFKGAFKPSVDGLLNSVNVCFQSVVSSMNTAAQAWAQDTATAYSATPIEIRTQKVDVECILENINGIRGIDVNLTSSVVAKLQSIASECESALTKAQQAVNDCGFIGGSQASALTNSLGTIKTKISTSVEEISTAAKTAIDNTVAQYTDTEGAISQAFNG